MMSYGVLQIEFINTNLGYAWKRTGKTTALEDLDQIYIED